MIWISFVPFIQTNNKVFMIFWWDICRNTHTIFHIFKKRAISCLVGFLINIIIPYLLSCGCFSKKKCQTRKKGFVLRLIFLKINKTTLLVCVGFCKCSFGCLGEDADVVQNVQKYSEFDRENIKNFPSSYSRCCWIFFILLLEMDFLWWFTVIYTDTVLVQRAHTGQFYTW